MEVIDSSWNQFAPNKGSRTYYNSLITSDQLKYCITIVNYVFLCGVISLFGIIANVINMVVLCREGLTTTINISFFALAVSDLCSLLFQQLIGIIINPSCQDLDWPIDYMGIQNYLGGIPRELFSRITCLITVYITAERCLCIALPLHVKQVITLRRTTIVIALMFILPILIGAPLYFTTDLGWRFESQRNRTLYGSVITSHYRLVQEVIFLSHGIVGILSFLAVVVLTSILIRKLGQKNVWKATALAQQEKSMSKKERSTIRMIILVASNLIICYIPSVVLVVTTFLVPEFCIGGRLYNMYDLTWSFAFLLENINSSINIFLYYKMSSKYRNCFHEIFNPCRLSDRNSKT